MKKTELVEFQGYNGCLLRGILLRSDIKNDNLVLMCGGFERRATTEPKFKKLADLLFDKNIASFRMDYSGCGLSDGDFSQTTVKQMSDELLLAVDAMKEQVDFKFLTVVAHSLSACAVARLVKKKLFKKMVLLAPALNQRDLLRYWFVKSNSGRKIYWFNYRDFLDEQKFKENCQKSRATKSSIIGSDYFLENMEKDYSVMLTSSDENILHIHGVKDSSVPIESVTVDLPNKLIVDGDHDIERFDVFKKWSEKAIKFII